jgi:hypothetical protein
MPKEADLTSPITISNKSSQAKQAASQNFPTVEPTKSAGMNIIRTKGPQKMNGKLGKGW